MTIVYELNGSLYLNLTNRCNCACTFCLRNDHNGVNDGQSLWLEHPPVFEEVRAALEAVDLSRYPEAVFCGYGEPTEALDLLLETGRYLKQAAPALRLRLNTNGLADLARGRPVAPLLAGIVDTVSISLNAPDPLRYLAVTRPRFGEGSFEALLAFAAACRDEGMQVVLTVVDLLPPHEIRDSRAIADELGVALRVRAEIRAAPHTAAN